MEVTEENGSREEEQVRWFSYKEAMQLDIFGYHHPTQLGNHGIELNIV